MKKDNLIRLYSFTLILVIVGLVIGQLFNQDAQRTNKNDAHLVNLAQLQATFSEQIATNALSMSAQFATTEKKFNDTQKRLSTSLDNFVKVRETLTKGDLSTSLNKQGYSSTADEILQKSESQYNEIVSSAKEILKLNFSDDEKDKQIAIASSLNSMFYNQRRFSPLARDLARQYETEASENKSGFSQAGYILALIIVGILILQAAFVFRPAVNLAYRNFMSANDAYIRLQKSEEELRKSAEKQLEFNEKLILSQRALEQRNEKLKNSEQEILLSSRKQIEVNEKLINVQDELRKAYDKVKHSEERMRSIAEEQLEATEKLMIAENKLKASLDHEKENKEELENTLSNLKNTQSQLVQSEKMASLGQLTAGIAHEINNPINFVYNGIDTLKVSLDDLLEIINKYDELEGNKDYKQVMSEIHELKDEIGYEDLLSDLRELVADIKKGAVRTIEIVKGLRVFSRLDEEEMKPANMNDSLDATLILLRNKTKNRIIVKKFYDESIDHINCFPGQLNQVFMNILNNAIQAIPEDKKGGEIQLYTENQHQHVMIKIKDNGSGMSEQVKRRIFEPFFTTKAVGIGTGLGMSITFGIIEKHRGNIYVTSEEGNGTEFSILIPKHLEESRDEQIISHSQSA
ncbi:MAG: GHKL domain-containing protein [Cyclobacteriaceae bacterium]